MVDIGIPTPSTVLRAFFRLARQRATQTITITRNITLQTGPIIIAKLSKYKMEHTTQLAEELTLNQNVQSIKSLNYRDDRGPLRKFSF